MRKKLTCITLVVLMLIGIMPTQRASASNADQLDISNEFLGVLKQFEGFYNAGMPYWDYAQYSIGYGSFCSYTQDDTYWYYMNNPITEEQASQMLVNELQYYINQVREYLKKYDLTVTQGQFDALVSLSYNIGATWTRNDGYYIHKAVKSGDINYVIYSLGLYSTAGGYYLEGLVSRRLSEASMFADGIYQRYPNSNMKYVLLDAAGGKVDYRMHTYDANRGSGIYGILTGVPTGPDKNGNTVTYVFDGWYTQREGGTKVEVLDGSLMDGAVLYAHWKTPDGDSVVVPEGTSNTGIEIKVTGNGVNLRTGPGTHYGVIDKVYSGENLTVTMTDVYRGDLWGKTERGWISLGYTDYSNVLNSFFPRWGTVIGDRVNVRQNAGMDAPVVGQKEAGDQVQILSWTHSGGRMWGEIEEGWICLSYVEMAPQEYNGKVVGIEVETLPLKTNYIQRHENLDLTGGTMKVSYEDCKVRSLPLSYAKVTGFDNTQLGTTTVTVSYAGFTATFDVNIIKATVTFVNYDGTVISANQYAYGEEVVPPEDPTRPEDNIGFYKFAGWDKELAPCDGNATYTATYTPIFIDYTVVFKNWDGTVLSSKTYHWGETVTEPEAPTKPADDASTYAFAGWDKTVVNCAGNATYTATFSSIDKLYTIVFKNWDGTVLSSKEYRYGDKVIVPTNPTKAADSVYTYTFAGWDKEVVSCAGNATYTAIYTPVFIDYTVVFKNWDGAVLSTQTYHYGDGVVPPEDPTRPEDNIGFYKFSGWDKELAPCDGNTTYTAQYTLWGRVEFKDYDGTVLSTKEYAAGEQIEAPAENPTRPADGTGVYNFIGWDREITTCTGNVTFNAMYELIGDVDLDGKVTEDDAIYLLRHVIFPERYPLDTFGDFVKDNALNEDDAIYLLRHIVFPERYPLTFGE